MTHLHRPSTLAALLAVAFGTSLIPSATCAAATATRVPPGFEALLEGQMERVDVRLLGRSLGLHPAKVTLDTLEFEQPGAIADALPLHGDDQAALRVRIAEALRSPLPRNGNLACVAGKAEGCGYLDTEGAAVIYDENAAAVELFLSKAWVAHLVKPDVRYRAVSDKAENAFVHRQSLNFSAGRDYRNLSLQGSGALGLTRDGYLGMNWSFVHAESDNYSDSDFRLNNVFVRRDIGSRHYAQAGRMDQRNLSSPLGGNFGFSMLPLPRFDGVRVGTTLAYLNNAVGDDATPVTVLLTRDARVDLYRGDELLGTHYLNAGVQTLNTSNLPTGSYTLSLRVFENGVLRRTDSVPFSKTGGALGDGQTQWFVQGGRIVETDLMRDRTQGVRERLRLALPDPANRLPGEQLATQAALDAAIGNALRLSGWQVRVPRYAVQAGARHGLGRGLTLTAGLAAMGGNSYGEARLEWQHAFSAGVMSAAASYFGGTDGARGNSQLLNFNNGMSWSLYRNQMRGTSCDPATTRSAIGDVGCYDSLSGTVSFPMGDWLASLGYNHNRSKGLQPLYASLALPGGPLPWGGAGTASGDMVSRAIQLGVNRSFQWRQAIVNARVSVFRSTNSLPGRGTDQGVLVGLTITSASQPPDAKGRSNYTTAGVDLRSSREGPTQVNYAVGHTRMWQDQSYRELGVNLSGQRDGSYTASVRGRLDNRFGDLSATLANSYQSVNGGNHPSLTGTYASSFAVGSSGFYWGGNTGGDEPAAAFAVKVGESADGLKEAAAELRGNGGRPLRLGFGERAMVPVEGYQATQVELGDATSAKAAGSINVSAGGGSKEYFLPPGKMVTREITADVTYLYVGRALAPNGKPMAGAAVLNAAVPALEQDGGFSIDARSRLSSLYLLLGGQFFDCPMPVRERRDVVQIVGESRCEPIQAAHLPEQIRALPRVGRLLETARRQALVHVPAGRL